MQLEKLEQDDSVDQFIAMVRGQLIVGNLRFTRRELLQILEKML